MTNAIIELTNRWLLGWPIVGGVIIVSLLCTIAFNLVQFRYFFATWKSVFQPEEAPAQNAPQADMTALQAFINTCSASIGNGSLAGVATAIYAGGPGSVFWLVVLGWFLMAVRFAEVYLSIYCAAESTKKAGLGGPMLYLLKVPGGVYLSYCYGLGVLIFSLIGGNAIQVNTMGLSLYTAWGISVKLSAVMFFLFIVYIVTGGARRITQASEAIVPLKVGLFLISSIAVLCFHYQALGSTLALIYKSAFHPLALAGGIVGFTVQQAMRFGISRVLFATESGLGTAAILFSATGSRTPVKDAIMSMLSTFISTAVCFMVGLCIIASGVWGNGLTSSALTISAFNTVFGVYGGWVVSFLSLTFGVGVLVSYAYITRAAWLFLTGGKYAWAINLIYCCVAFVGTLAKVDAVWYAAEVIQSILLIINLFAIVYLIPLIRKGLAAYRTNKNG